MVFEKYAYGRLDMNFLNFWYLACESGNHFPAYSDRELRTFRDPVKKYLKTENSPWLSFTSDTALNKPYYANVSWTRQWFEGGPSTNWYLGQIIKPHYAFEVQIGTTYAKNEGERRYIETLEDLQVPITGLRRLSQLNQTLQLSYAFDPKFTLQLSSQWLAGTWNYRDFKHYVDNDTLAYGLVPSKTEDSARSWTLNFITRWEFRPGSAAYLVYTHSVATSQLISQNAALSPWNDLSQLIHMPSDDAIQLKVSWLFR
jgi:hypothetical protein